MNFCKMCGKALPGAAASTKRPAAGGNYGFAEGLPSAATLFKSGTVKQGSKPPVNKPAANRSSDAYMATMAPSNASVAAVSDAGSAATMAAPMPGIEATDTGLASGGRRFGRLVIVSRDGTDGEAFELEGDQVDVGRTQGAIQFPSDRYLAPRHARFMRHGAQVKLRSLDRVNGVFIRLTGPKELHDHDVITLGKQVFRFELLSPEEQQPTPAVEHGVALFGTPPRRPWGRLCQLETSGLVRDVYHLVHPEVVIGREDGDHRFPGDEFMSRRHAALAQEGRLVQLTDLGSSNGSYVRLSDERLVVPGDLLRMGDQLVRYDR